MEYWIKLGTYEELAECPDSLSCRRCKGTGLQHDIAGKDEPCERCAHRKPPRPSMRDSIDSCGHNQPEGQCWKCKENSIRGATDTISESLDVLIKKETKRIEQEAMARATAEVLGTDVPSAQDYNAGWSLASTGAETGKYYASYNGVPVKPHAKGCPDSAQLVLDCPCVAPEMEAVTGTPVFKAEWDEGGDEPIYLSRCDDCDRYVSLFGAGETCLSHRLPTRVMEGEYHRVNMETGEVSGVSSSISFKEFRDPNDTTESRHRRAANRSGALKSAYRKHRGMAGR